MNTRWLSAVAGLVAVAALAGTAFANAPMKVTVKTVTPVKTIPLRDLQYVNLPPIMRRIIGDARFSQRQINQLYNKLIQEGYLQRASGQFAIHNPWKKPALSQAPRVQDRAIQTKLYGPQPNSITAGQAFPGIGASNTPPDSVGCEPPDTDMAVGANDVVELVNLCEGSGTGYFKAWNKLTGAVIQNTTSLSGMWGANSGCDQGGGDNMVLYDQLANRWIMSQLNNLDDGICVAISETGDPTGAYYLYNFPIVASGSLSDYPKVAVWPDAYYVSTNDFEDFSYFEHVDFTALDRSAMLTGSAATMIIINGQDNGLDYSVLPADLDGMTPPPANDPGIFVNFGSPYESGTPYALNFWRMHVDFANPDSSTLSGPVSLAVDAFNDGICGGGLGGGCIPQPSGAEG
ncbi:MAG: hypothetical protein ACRES7_11150, partial [Gammaproteobacteria bacterium]